MRQDVDDFDGFWTQICTEVTKVVLHKTEDPEVSLEVVGVVLGPFLVGSAGCAMNDLTFGRLIYFPWHSVKR